jgi:hypothetical protein
MGVLLLQAMHLCLSREPTSWTLCAINPHIHAPWFASWTCHKIFPQFIYIYIFKTKKLTPHWCVVANSQIQFLWLTHFWKVWKPITFSQSW